MRRALPLERLGPLLGSGRGLGADEARARLARFGPNDVRETAEPAWRALARETARDPMLWFLVAVSGLYAALGERLEAAVLAASLLPLGGMDAFLHRRTQASTEGLRQRLATRARVWRDGAARALPARELVPGDLVELAAGDAIPADGALEACAGLQVDESALTGESQPVRKAALPPERGARPAALEDRHWGLAGTRALAGTARLRVAFTGAETLYGEIVRSAALGPRARTSLELSVASLVRGLVAAAAVTCLGLAWVRLQQGFGWVDAAVSALTLAVAALPEEFPVVVSMFLGVGVYRLARRKALVRRATSVENVGRVTCICSDKTGTVTEGRLRRTHALPADGVSEERLLARARAAARGESGDPLDAALLEGAPPAERALAVFPFTEDRRRETAVLAGDGGEAWVATKGAPEAVLPLVALDAAGRRTWEARAEALALEGHKVLAVASRTLPAEGWAGGEPDRGFLLDGLLAFEDPLREGVADAVAQCQRAGIRVLLVTGDHPGTAATVAREIGLGGGAPVVIGGEEMEARLAADPGSALARVDAIARAVPAQKLALVRALQAAGEVVAVTGDGVNDVPALQAADVGIAMGERGTRSAREVASIVLLDDNLTTIVAAIAEGRQLFRNLRLAFLYLLMVHLPLVASAALIPLAGFPLLYLPVHVVWLELVIHPSALLGFQALPSRRGLEPERARGARFLSARAWALVAVVGGLLTALLVAGYARSLGRAHDVAHARSASLVTLVFASAGLLAVLSRLRTAASRWIAAASLASAFVLVGVPAAAALLHLSPLHGDDWLLAGAMGLAVCAPAALLRRL